MSQVRISVIIPSFDASRTHSLARLQTAIAQQTMADHEVIVVPGVSPQGRAINLGADKARGDVLIIVDDDSEIRDPRLFDKLLRVVSDHPDVGMAGASLRTADDAPWFQRRAAQEFPRFNVPIVREVVDSDLPCHGCVAIPKRAFTGVGGEREEIVRGLDPDLRQRMRAAGYRVVLVPDAVVYHPLPPTLTAFVRTFLRNGAGSANAQSHHPELVFETDESVDMNGFVVQRSFRFRVARFPFRVLWALLTLRPFRALGYACYAAGFVAGYWRERRPPTAHR